MTSPEQKPHIGVKSKEKVNPGTTALLYLYLAIATGITQTAYRVRDAMQTLIWLKHQLDRNKRITKRLIDRSKKLTGRNQT